MSAKLVYKVLEYEGPLTRKQLTERTRLTSRAVGDVLDDLEREGYIEKDVYLPDARQRIYRLRV